MWLKYVDPDEEEQEHFEVYERALAEIPLEMTLTPDAVQAGWGKA
jgi:hypothetical protein